MDRVLSTPEEIMGIVEDAVSAAFQKILNEQIIKPKTETPDILNITQAMALLAENGYPLAENTFRTKTQKGIIPCIKINRRSAYSRKELLNWLEAERKRPYNRVQAAAEQMAKTAKNQGA